MRGPYNSMPLRVFDARCRCISSESQKDLRPQVATFACATTVVVSAAPLAALPPAGGADDDQTQPRAVTVTLTEGTNIAAALRHHARDPHRPLVTYKIM